MTDSREFALDNGEEKIEPDEGKRKNSGEEISENNFDAGIRLYFHM
jgi:hypothetical protein